MLQATSNAGVSLVCKYNETSSVVLLSSMVGLGIHHVHVMCFFVLAEIRPLIHRFIACQYINLSFDHKLYVLQPFMGSSDSSNKISGKIKLGSETLFTIDGRWDQEVFLKDKSTGVSKLVLRKDIILYPLQQDAPEK